MSELLAEFSILGEAKTAGSKKAFQHPHTKRIIVTDDTGKAGKLWRQDVQAAASGHFTAPDRGPIEMVIIFYRPRPQGHFGTGRNSGVLKASAPTYPATRPDVDKLSRAVLDALKGIAWHDDAQVVTKLVAKRFAPAHRTVVRIFRAHEEPVTPEHGQLALVDSLRSGCYHGGNGHGDRTEALTG